MNAANYFVPPEAQCQAPIRPAKDPAPVDRIYLELKGWHTPEELLTLANEFVTSAVNIRLRADEHERMQEREKAKAAEEAAVKRANRTFTDDDLQPGAVIFHRSFDEDNERTVIRRRNEGYLIDARFRVAHQFQWAGRGDAFTAQGWYYKRPE